MKELRLYSKYYGQRTISSQEYNVGIIYDPVAIDDVRAQEVNTQSRDGR